MKTENTYNWKCIGISCNFSQIPPNLRDNKFHGAILDIFRDIVSVSTYRSRKGLETYFSNVSVSEMWDGLWFGLSSD